MTEDRTPECRWSGDAQRAEAAERELAICERASQRNADAHMAAMRQLRAAEARLARIQAALESNIRESGGMFNAVTAKQLRAALDAPQGTVERLADPPEGDWAYTEGSAGLRSETL